MSIGRDALLSDADDALSQLSRIHSGIADPALAAFSDDRKQVGDLIVQIIAVKDAIFDGPGRHSAWQSAGIGRAVVESANDLAHPLAALCMDIEARYNHMKKEPLANA